MRGGFADRDCHVLGNGPSLAFLDPKTLEGDLIISMNAFGLHPKAHEIEVDYHCLADPRSSFFEWQSVQELKDRGYVPPRLRNLVIHSSHLPYLEHSNPADPAVWSVYMGRPWTDVSKRRAIDLSAGIGNCQSTAVLGIALALHLGPRRIYLHGMEHSYLADPVRSKGPTISALDHFYQEAQHQQLDARNSQAVKVESAHTRSFLEHILLVEAVFQQHSYLASMSNKSGIPVFNTTPNSFLDSYDK